MFDKAFSDVLVSNKRSASSGRVSLFDGFFGFGSAAPGARTSTSNFKTSLKLSAVYNAVDIISNDIAKISFTVLKKDGKNNIEQDLHYATYLLSVQPNPLMTPFIWKKTMTTSVLLRGNGLSIIVSGASGSASELRFVDWSDVDDILLKDNQLLYKIKGYDAAFLSSEVIHWKSFSHNGIVGVSVITYAAQQMNLAIEVQEFSATNFENKGVRQGVVETEKAIPNGKDKIIAGIKAAFSEKDATRVAVLDEGMVWKAITITPQEAQIVEMSRFTIEDIARWFNIAPHKIKSLQQSTNNNIEQQSLDHVSDTIQPYITNIEQELRIKLLTETEKKTGFKIKGNMNVLLRSDIKSRAEWYSKMVQSGVYSREEVRGFEEMNEGPKFLSEHLTPTNTFTEKQIEKNLSKNTNGK